MEVDDIISYHDVVTAAHLRSDVPRVLVTLVIVDLSALVFNRARWRSPAQSR